jgi:hypothetical protein
MKKTVFIYQNKDKGRKYESCLNNIKQAMLDFFSGCGLLWESFLAVWLHGTLEISTIVAAGCTGITVENGWLFSKIYTRLKSL